MSTGEDRVRIGHGDGPLIANIKRQAANFIDECEMGKSHAKNGEEARLWSLAATCIEEACMWAVKATTYEPYRERSSSKA